MKSARASNAQMIYKDIHKGRNYVVTSTETTQVNKEVK